MRKFIIILLLGLVSLTSFAQDTTSVKSQITEAERIIDKYSEKG